MLMGTLVDSHAAGLPHPPPLREQRPCPGNASCCRDFWNLWTLLVPLSGGL